MLFSQTNDDAQSKSSLNNWTKSLFLCWLIFVSVCARVCDLRAGAWKKRYWAAVTSNHLWRCWLGNDFVSESILYHLRLITQRKGCWQSCFGCLARCISLSTARRKIISPVWLPVTFIRWHHRNSGLLWNCWCCICCCSALKLELQVFKQVLHLYWMLGGVFKFFLNISSNILFSHARYILKNIRF